MLLNAFVLVLFVLIVQTSVGILQGLIERVDGWAQPRLGRSMSSMQHAGLSAVVLLLSVGLSVVGVVDLVAAGYGLLSIAFLFTFATPVLTVGVRRIRKFNRTPIPTRIQSRSTGWDVPAALGNSLSRSDTDMVGTDDVLLEPGAKQ